LPLLKGRSKKTASKNISEMMESYDKTGMIGHARPESREKAQKMAVAAAMEKAGMSRKKGGGKGKGKGKPKAKPKKKTVK